MALFAGVTARFVGPKHHDGDNRAATPLSDHSFHGKHSYYLRPALVLSIGSNFPAKINLARLVGTEHPMPHFSKAVNVAGGNVGILDATHIHKGWTVNELEVFRWLIIVLATALRVSDWWDDNVIVMG